MNTVFIIPTGLGCVIGGHAGDATPAAKLMAQTCDKLILHPNVVNASDINEMPHNSLYVEGSILDRFLEGRIELQEVTSNRILVVISPPIKPETVNAINAARVTIGAYIEILELNTPLIMWGEIRNGIATGSVEGLGALILQVKDLTFDALAIASQIQVSEEVALKYLQNSKHSVNPWGGIEAHVSRRIADAINKPVAHAPIEYAKKGSKLFNLLYDKVVNPRKAAEVCSNCFLHCVLKGLHQAPNIGYGISNRSVSALITPTGCVGRPHQACFRARIPVIAVKENTCVLNEHDDRIIYAANYLEAAGIMSCINAGVQPSTVRG